MQLTVGIESAGAAGVGSRQWVAAGRAPVMRLLSMDESDRRSIFSPEVDCSASSEGAGAASARLSCR